MKKTTLLLIVSVAISSAANAQLLKGIGNIVKAKVTQKASGELDKKIDKILNGSTKKTESTKDDSGSEDQKIKGSGPISAYSKYDFIPGEKVLYFDDFGTAATGELPLGWNASGKGEVVNLDGFDGKWLRVFPGSTYLSANSKALGENYTVEFDVIMNGTPPSGTRFLPDFEFGLLSTGKFASTYNSFLESRTTVNNKLQVVFKPNVDKISTVKLESSGASSTSTFKSGILDIASFSETLGKVAHYSVQVQKQRFRLWVNGQKVYDIPRAINLAPALNQLYFKPAEYWMYNESNFGLYLSNFKIATGIADSRSRLIDEGKFSTAGILFENGSSTILPQSYGLLKEIGVVMSESRNTKFRITGHCDNLGDAKKNIALSLKRAQAVGEYLEDHHKVDAKNLEFDGKGAGSPIGDNKTQEGRAQNRRVEFVKL